MKCGLDLLDIVVLDYLIKARLVQIEPQLQANTYAFGWAVANVAFKHTLAIVLSDKGEEADYEEYFSAVQVIASIVDFGLSQLDLLVVCASSISLNRRKSEINASALWTLFAIRFCLVQFVIE